MPIFQHNELPTRTVPRITTRVLVDLEGGATSSTIWEQWIEPAGFIPLHYHEVEEVLVLLAGSVELTLSDETSEVDAPASILVPPRELHALRPDGNEAVHLLAFFPVVSPAIFAPDGSLRPLPWEDTRARPEPDSGPNDLP